MKAKVPREWDIFCENVRWLAEQHNLTNQEMASAMHISEPMLLRIINHEMPQQLCVNVILTTATHFGYELSTLFRPLW